MSSFRHTTGILLAAGILATAVQAAQRGPAPTATNLPPDVLGLACAPVATPGEPPMPLRITGGQDSSVRHTYSPGDLVTINAGIENGIEVGQEYFVRRLQLPRFGKATRSTPGNIHTAGWIRVWAVDDTMSLATITFAVTSETSRARVAGCDCMGDAGSGDSSRPPTRRRPSP
jgi:hypothetical protein